MPENTAPASVVIDGTAYTREPDHDEYPVQIVVIEGRWNLVGRVERHGDGSLTIWDAQVIRYWGTTSGLGELATWGPREKTKLDPAGVCHVPAHAVLLVMNCVAPSWEPSL